MEQRALPSTCSSPTGRGTCLGRTAGHGPSAQRTAGLPGRLVHCPGEVSSLRRGEGIDAAANGILIFSRTSVAQREVMDDYAALLGRVHNGGKRFIPVLIDDVPLPTFARIRRPVNFTPAESGTYEQKVIRLLKAVKNDSAI